MSYRSAIQRLVVRSARSKNLSSLAGDRTLFAPSTRLGRAILPFDECCHSGGGSSGWDENFRDHVKELEPKPVYVAGGRRGNSDEDSNADGNWGVDLPAQDFWGRNSGRILTQSGHEALSSAQIGMLGCSDRACSHNFGRFSRTSLGDWNGLGNRAGSGSVRFYSSTPAPVVPDNLQTGNGGTLDSLAGVTDAASTAASVAALPSTQVVSEVAASAADSSYPTAAIQYIIEGVHLSTGLPWWASIAATTVAIRILVLPILVYQMKATARLTLMRPELEKLTNHIKENNYDPKIVEENQLRMKALFQQHKTSPLSPILGAFVQAPIFMCFFFAIRTMAEKVESFKEGGALWFTDLSTPDSLFIMPVLSGAFFLLTVELGATDGMQGQPVLAKMKMFLRGLAVLLVPLTASFPKALFCYWLTANICSIVQAGVFKQPGVKAALGIPDVSHMAKPDGPVAPVVTFSQPPRPHHSESKVSTPKTFSQPPRLHGEGRMSSTKKRRA